LDKYDPDKYECRAATNPNGIYLKSNIVYDGKTYKAVLIGEQTWMAENLNYAASGSKCGVIGDPATLSDNNTATCDTYGRLYDWATAMALQSSCNSSYCNIDAKHKGVCPTGWHIPSNADWNTLMKYVNPNCTDNSHCTDAGTKLKAKSGWNTGNDDYIPGTDEFGFSALPGGYGRSDGDFYDVGNYGYWWSSSEYSSNFAYRRRMGYYYEYVYYDYYGKSLLFSVRCLQD
jgi:uncharacterized protein (TIGR02145 family)